MPDNKTGLRRPFAHDSDADHWRILVETVGAAVAAPLTAALERVQALSATGRIERSSLRSLLQEIDAAREAGIIAQRLTRLSAGAAQQSPEWLPLHGTINEALGHHHAEKDGRLGWGSERTSTLVMVDASLLLSLLNAVVEWALQHAHSRIEFNTSIKAWPANAQLACRFSCREAGDPAKSGAMAPTLDTLTWRLIEQTAWAAQLLVSRHDAGDVTQLFIEFPRTQNDRAASSLPSAENRGLALETRPQPLAGNQILVVAPRHELRRLIRDAIKDMGLIVDEVASVAEAATFCADGLPHAIIFDGALNGAGLDQLREGMGAQFPDLVFIEIDEGGDAFEMSGHGNAHVACVTRAAVASALPSVLMYELSKGGV
jgi:CheY-like chemotaxis protein